MEHIQKDYEGSAIERWEKEHYIVRVVRNGCEYVICTDFKKFQEKCAEEKRLERMEYIAAQQAEAYMGLQDEV